MYILGINGGFRAGYQDVSTVLVKDGEVIAAIEEERLSRVKFSAGRLPYLSILEVMKIGNISIQDVDLLAFHGSTWQAEIDTKLESYFNAHFGFCPPIKRYHHHDCHAASAYYASGFEKALIVTIDGSGDGVSVQIATGINGKINVIHREERPNSLGIFYSLITQYCGFVRDADEYKLMGLASYGNRKQFDFSWLLEVQNGSLKISQDYLTQILPGQPSPHRDEMLFNADFENKMGKGRRIPKSEIETFYMDIAASAQEHFEICLLQLINYYIKSTGLHNLCLAGGSALNCVANQKIMNSDFVEDIFVQPASSDAGISLGAAWLASLENKEIPIKPSNTYLGIDYTNDEIEQILKSSKVFYSKIDNPAEVGAKLISENKVIGWFQGRMEFGPRALGNRSILANPCNPNMQQIVNERIKFREGFRPFCPSVLEEDMDKYFIGKSKVSPYMTITCDTTDYAQMNIPGVIHFDKTARIQTVSKNQNSIFYNLISEFKKLTGHGVLLNTSFNLSHEPIVCSPRDALATFYSSGLDALFLGNYLVEK